MRKVLSKMVACEKEWEVCMEIYRSHPVFIRTLCNQTTIVFKTTICFSFFVQLFANFFMR